MPRGFAGDLPLFGAYHKKRRLGIPDPANEARRLRAQRKRERELGLPEAPLKARRVPMSAEEAREKHLEQSRESMRRIREQERTARVRERGIAKRTEQSLPIEGIAPEEPEHPYWRRATKKTRLV